MKLSRLSNNRYPSFPAMIENFFDGNLIDWTNWNFAGSNSNLPAVNVKESENEYEIEVASPGLRKEDFKVNLDNNRLIISSEYTEGKGEVDDKYTRREFSYHSSQRTFTVPDEIIDSGKIQAKYTDGILHISLPKKQEVVKPKLIKEITIA